VALTGPGGDQLSDGRSGRRRAGRGGGRLARSTTCFVPSAPARSAHRRPRGNKSGPITGSERRLDNGKGPHDFVSVRNAAVRRCRPSE
jgi:hypothetical protein